MAKRGRKPGTHRKGYFYEKEEQAVIDYNTTKNLDEKNRIFREILYPAFTKMIESIIRRYNLFVQDELYDETFVDTMSFLMTKIEKFNPESGYKAYSYCGTICKNYLISKIGNFAKRQKINLPYETAPEDMTNNILYSDSSNSLQLDFLNELLIKTVKEIRTVIDNQVKYGLTENDIKVGEALINILQHWEDLFETMGSNKFNKSSIFLFLREETCLTTKDIRDSLKKYKTPYYLLKKRMN